MRRYAATVRNGFNCGEGRGFRRYSDGTGARGESSISNLLSDRRSKYTWDGTIAVTVYRNVDEAVFDYIRKWNSMNSGKGEPETGKISPLLWKRVKDSSAISEGTGFRHRSCLGQRKAEH